VASYVKKKNNKQKHAKYLTCISSNAVFIRLLVNTPTKVKKILAVKGLNNRNDARDTCGPVVSHIANILM
jgi:hypothetical protein